MNQNRSDIPIQPVEQPILCSPYEKPNAHWFYEENGEVIRQEGRRDAGYWYKTQRTGSAQLQMFREEEWDDLPLVNALRADVERWRETNYRNATPVTRELLRHWARNDLLRRLFFCQREAVETIIYLAEIRQGGKRIGFNPQFTDENLAELIDSPNEQGIPDLIRYGCKMATGSGKTVVMAMLIAWAFCNRGKVPSDERFPQAALVVCPNLTIKKRLQVLRPEDSDNYYDEFELIPHKLRPLLNSGKVMVTNWHQFAPESPHSEGGQTYAIVDKGEETPDAFAKRVLGELYDRAPIMVLNDEGHHAYRPAPTEDKLSAEERKERQEATVWVSGLDTFNQACGVKFCVDLSATPFYIQGSGHPEGSPFPWLVSDFGLVDAIESGITKIPRLPVSDTTGRPEPKFFRLWKTITDDLSAADTSPGRRRRTPKPEAIYREAEAALITLASQWKERFEYIQEASDAQEKTPPVLIVVCADTDIAEYFYQRISGEREEEVVDDSSAGEKRKKKKETKTVYGQDAIFPELANGAGVTRTLRIDSKMLAAAESEDPNRNRSQAAEDLRQIVATIGKGGQLGEQIRCVVSVAMLNEGWDANNVTHILGLRAFASQLLCEQVVGRGLRRMNYTPDPETGLLTEEYVDVYGIPFSVIPFRGRATGARAPMTNRRIMSGLYQSVNTLRSDFRLLRDTPSHCKRTRLRQILHPRNRSVSNLKLIPLPSMSNPLSDMKPAHLPHRVQVQWNYKTVRCIIKPHTFKPSNSELRIGLSTNWSVIAKPPQTQTATRNSGCSLDTVSFRKSLGLLIRILGTRWISVDVTPVSLDRKNTLRAS